jgi:hypothetical protein
MSRLSLFGLVLISGCGTLLGLGDLIYDVEPGDGGSAQGGGDGGMAGPGGTGGGAMGGTGGVGGMPIEAVHLGNHVKGQATDKIGGGDQKIDEVMFAFRVEVTEAVIVEQLVVRGTVVALSAATVVGSQLWLDDGAVLGAHDSGDTLLSAGSADTELVFAEEFTLSEPSNLIVTVQLDGVGASSGWTLDLSPADVTAVFISDGTTAGASGSITPAIHLGQPWDLAINDVRLLYRHGSQSGPMVRTYDVSSQSWGPQTATVAVGGAIKFIATPELSRRDDQMVAVSTQVVSGTTLSLLRLSQSGWVVDWTAPDLGPASPDKRAFDIAYEDGSRVAMVVYALNGPNPVYRLRIGDEWLDEEPVFTSPPDGNVEWIELVSRPGSNEIALLYSNEKAELYGAVWDGQAWTDNAQLIEPALNVTHFQNFAASYEEVSRDLLVVWAHPVGEFDGFFAATKPSDSKTFNAGLYQSGLTKPGAIALMPERGTDRIAMAHVEHSCNGDSCDNLEGAIWNGSTMTGKAAIDGELGEPYGSRPGTQPIAVSWVGTSDIAVAVYVDGTHSGVDWARWSNASWTLEPDAAVAPTMGKIVNAQALDLGSHAMFIIGDLAGNLWAKTTNGSTWSNTEGGAPLGQPNVIVGQPFRATRRP